MLECVDLLYLNIWESGLSAQTHTYPHSHPPTRSLTILFIFPGGSPDKRSRKEVSPIHAACRSGHIVAVRMLLDAGASVYDETEVTGQGVLHYAVLSDNPNLIRFLVHEGADVNATDKQGVTAFHIASQRHKIRALHELLRHVEPRTRLSATGQTNMTPAHMAAREGDGLALRLLLAHDPSAVHEIDARGRTPLHWAVDHGDIFAIVAAFHASALHVRDADYLTPIELAQQHDLRVAEAFMTHGE